MFDNLVEGIMEKVTKKRKVRTDAEPVEMTVVKDEAPVEAPIEKERPKVKMWKKQPNVVIDLDPTVSITLIQLQADQDALIKQFEQNQFAIRKIKGGVLTHFQVATQSLDAVKVLNAEGVYQLDVPQADVLVEKEA